MKVRAFWIASMILAGGLVGLRRGWRRQVADGVGCMMALGLAYWQHPRIVPYVRLIWPELGSMTQTAALLYIFAVIYGFTHVLSSLYLPKRAAPVSRRWISGVIGAAEAGAVAALSVMILPRL